MKEIIFDLLSVGKSPKTFTINPEVKQTYYLHAVRTGCWDEIFGTVVIYDMKADMKVD